MYNKVNKEKLSNIKRAIYINFRYKVEFKWMKKDVKDETR